MTPVLLRRALAECNGGPGLTVAELAERTGMHVCEVQAVIASLFFETHEVTTRPGPAPPRYVLGDPRRELVAGRPETAPLAA